MPAQVEECRALMSALASARENTPRVGALEETVYTAVSECWDDMGDRAGFSISAQNGPISVMISAYDGLAPGDLVAVAHKAMAAVCAAVCAMDPDVDGDIDVPGAPAADTDHDAGMPAAPESTQTAPEGASTTTTTAVAKEATVSGESTAAETTARAPATAGGVYLTAEQFDVLLNGRKGAKGKAPKDKKAAGETAPAATETEEQRIARLVDERLAAMSSAATPPAAETAETDEERIARMVDAQVTAAVQARVEQGALPTRKGVQRPTSETADGGLNEHGLPASWPNKPLHQYTPAELGTYGQRALVPHMLRLDR